MAKQPDLVRRIIEGLCYTFELHLGYYKQNILLKDFKNVKYSMNIHHLITYRNFSFPVTTLHHVLFVSLVYVGQQRIPTEHIGLGRIPGKNGQCG